MGSAAGNVGILNVNSSGVFTTGTGAVTINVQLGATMTTGDLTIAGPTSTNAIGTINVDGSDSTFTQMDASTLTLGHAMSGTAARSTLFRVRSA
jgi:hypothetical protein